MVHASFVICLVSLCLGLRKATPPVCLYTPPEVFSSHQATYDNRDEYVPPTLPSACVVIVACNSVLTISEILLSARTRQFCSRFRVPACRLHPTSNPAFTLHQTSSLQAIGAKHRCRLQVFTKILHFNLRPSHWFALYKPCLQQSLSMSQTELQTSNIKTRPGCRHLRLPYL